MPVPFLDAMAQAIYCYEGHQPQDVNHENNNPGNLRLDPKFGYPVDGRQFTIFPDFITGYSALLHDLRAKITGANEHGLNQESTLDHFFEVYAPSSDSNSPMQYASFVAWWLSETYNRLIEADNTFAQILQAIGQTVS